MSIDHSTSPVSQHHGRSTSESTIFGSIPLAVCAQACTLYYIKEGYPRCDATDLACLCSNYSTDGYTLGETALVCLASQCSEPSDSERGDAYNICVDQNAAVDSTHTVLSNLPAITSTAVLTKSDSAPATITTVWHTSSAIATWTVPATAAASSLSERSHGSGTLSTAQTIGISVAALGVVIVAIAGFYLAVHLRRRKRKDQRHSYDFVDDAPARFSLHVSNHGSTMFSGGLPSETHHASWPVAKPPQVREKDPIRSPRTARSISLESLRSDCSMRTVSQLLPERPGSRPPQPAKKSPQRPDVNTPTTVSEDHSNPVIPKMLYPGLPAHPAAFKARLAQYAEQYTRCPEQSGLPALSLSIPGKPYTVREANIATDFELLPAPPAMTSTSSGRCDSAGSNHRSSSHSLLKYYTSVGSGSSEDLYSATPIEEQIQVRRPPPAAITVTRPVFPPRAVRTSTASDASHRTSFESTDPDEATPPEEEDKRLTPVAESPLAAIRYPKVPRSSNQAVPRSSTRQLSPQSVEWPAIRDQLREGQKFSRHSPSPSGSTLAAKRRGNTAQQDLELGLKIHDSAYASHSRKDSQQSNCVSRSQNTSPPHRQEIPLKEHGRVADRVQRDDATWPLPATMKVAAKSPPLRSPLWEPKLTPRREGEDLYLSVSIATPLEAHFRR